MNSLAGKLVKAILLVFLSLVANGASFKVLFSSNASQATCLIPAGVVSNAFGTTVTIQVSRAGVPVPAVYSSNGISFVAERYESPYSSNNTYILSVGVPNATSQLATFPAITTQTNKFEKNLIHKIEYAPYPWIEKTLLSASSFSKSITVNAPLSSFTNGPSELVVRVHNGSASSLSVDVNGINIATNLPFSSGLLAFTNPPLGPTNSVKVVCLSGQIDYDGLEIRYQRLTSALTNIITNLLAVSDHNFSPTNKADHLIIYPTNFTAEAAILAAYRNDHGLKSITVPVSAIYDHFNHGFPDPRVIRSFLYQSCVEWEVGPKYVTLLGHGSLDYLNYKNDGSCMIPAFVSVDADGVARSSDASMTDFDQDGGLDVAIGRISIASTNDFYRWFLKMTNFEASSSYKTNGTASAGYPDTAGIYNIDSDLMISLSPSLYFSSNYAISLPPSVIRSNILNEVNAGRGMFSYFGQGTFGQIGDTDENFLTSADTTLLTNKMRPCIFWAMSCLAGDFGSFLNTPSIGEQMVFSTDGGSVATFGANGIVFGPSSRRLASIYASNLFFNGQNRLGDGLAASMREMANYGEFITCQAYNLLGDPATAIWSASQPRQQPFFLSINLSYSNYAALTVPPVIQDSTVFPEDGDFDGDGVSNRDEFLTSTDILDPFSFLRIVAMTRTNISWQSKNNKIYQLQWSTNLSNFSSVVTTIGRFPTSSLSVTNVGFYRIVLDVSVGD